MFNNFSILSELIVENRTLAERFLENLSSVYRYVIQNLKRDTVPVSEELDFLRSYLYLIGMRYENAISVDVDEQLERTDGRIPPRLPPAAGRKRHQTQPLVGTPTVAYSRLSGRKPHCGEKRPLPRVVRPVIYRYRTTEHHRALLPVVRGKACHQEKRTFIYSQITYYTRRLCTS